MKAGQGLPKEGARRGWDLTPALPNIEAPRATAISLCRVGWGWTGCSAKPRRWSPGSLAWQGCVGGCPGKGRGTAALRTRPRRSWRRRCRRAPAEWQRRGSKSAPQPGSSPLQPLPSPAAPAPTPTPRSGRAPSSLPNRMPPGGGAAPPRAYLPTLKTGSSSAPSATAASATEPRRERAGRWLAEASRPAWPVPAPRSALLCSALPAAAPPRPGGSVAQGGWAPAGCCLTWRARRFPLPPPRRPRCPGLGRGERGEAGAHSSTCPLAPGGQPPSPAEGASRRCVRLQSVLFTCGRGAVAG